MKAHEVAFGTCSLIELVPADAKTFDMTVTLRSEVALQFSEATGQSLLRVGTVAVSVSGRDKQGQAVLARLRDRNLPRLGWVVAVTPKSGTTESLQVQMHEFPVQYSWPGDIDIGVDEKIVDVIRQKLGKSISATEVIQWLTERFVLVDQESGSKVFISGSPAPESDHRRPFRMHGKGYAIDVQKTPDDRLLVTRLVEARRGTSAEERRPIVPVQGNVRFCDSTIAGAFRGTARSQLDQLVEQAGSYLNVWREYNKLERDSVFRRARTLGWLSYSDAKRQADGRWRFRIQDAKQIDTALNLLRGAEDVDLEAASHPPRELQESSDASASGLSTDGDSARSPKAFVGSFVGGTAAGRYLDVLPTGDLDDREPPVPGVLFMSMSGDRKRLERRERAQASIALAECPMPQLGLLLEGSAVPERRRKAEAPLSAAVKDIFGDDPTPRQIEAIRVALNTPDIALIQGPPGTGKTKTIAALQARLAELGEDGDLAGQTLLTSYQHDAVENAVAKTLVFGLPAIKVGRKQGRSDDGDGFDRWRRERVDAIRADLASLPERPVSEVLRKVRAMSAAYQASRLGLAESAKMVREIEDIARPYLSPSVMDRLLAIRQELSAQYGSMPNFESDDRELLLKAVRALRIDPISFGDDGARNAARVMQRLERFGSLDDNSRRLLSAAADWDADELPRFLGELKALQEVLIDRFAEPTTVGGPRGHADLEELLPEIVNELFSRARESSGGEDAVLYEYLFDLENDIDGVRSAVRDYTVVLAATCQQAVGFQMSLQKGEQSVFANVIVDEAARANPLDLFIPMALAERRIILVGDHRQLPHILEPDVEGQLELSVSDETRKALRRSLFQRLFESMRAREAADGIKRTVTLDVQYRMHPVLGTFVSDTFYAPYGEAFRSEKPAEQFEHGLPGYQPHVAAWVNVPLSAGKEQGGQSKRRPAEAHWIAKELKNLATARPDLSFGVISFYAGQVDEILGELEVLGVAEQLQDGSYRVADAWRETRGLDGHLKERIRVGTVDAFQGKEFDVVFLSMTRSNDLPISDERSLRRKFGHLMLENRLCVAMSRQQRLLIVVGDLGMLRGEVGERSLAGLVAFRKLCEGRHGCVISA
ncbi:MAG TPA: AAA domain-containing protein [Nitrospira sp.]|nr:AAA domain-containing protein [Nitrospira sp.]